MHTIEWCNLYAITILYGKAPVRYEKLIKNRQQQPSRTRYNSSLKKHINHYGNKKSYERDLVTT